MELETIQIQLSALWVCLMLTYLLGDVLRLFSGDFIPGVDGKEFTPAMWLGISMFMLIPILMVFLSLTLDRSVNRWANIGIAVLFFVFNLLGLPTYKSSYDKFLIVVGLGFNLLTVGYAWGWD